MTTGEIRNFERETGPWIPERGLIKNWADFGSLGGNEYVSDRER